MKNKILDWLITIIVSLAIYGFISIFILTIRVDGESMYPNFGNNDLLITTRAYLHDDFKYGDVIIFSTSNKKLIKRVIGVGGDTVKIEEGKVYVNGIELNEPYINNEPLESMEVTVSPDTYFVMGDNRQNSIDSRFDEIGLIHKDDVFGKVVFRVFSNMQIIKEVD